MNRPALALALLLFALPAATAQNDPQKSALSLIDLSIDKNSFSPFYYKDFKPDDVPQEVYVALWEIQKEVIDHFTYDYDVLNGRKKSHYFAAIEDYYKYGKGVCEDYTNFFILLAREKGLTKNLYKVSGNGNRGGHAWLEYRTAKNTYIIDPTWSDDSQFNGQQKKKLRESSAYGKQAFFITYEEDKRIFNYQGYDHSSYTTRRTEVALWDKEEGTP